MKQITERYDMPKREQALKEIMELGYGTYEYRWLHSDGSIRTIHGSASLVYNNEGKPFMLNGIASDITSLRQAEEKAKDNDRKLSDILESITDNFFVMDKDFKFAYVNKHFEQTMQLSRQNLIGQSVWDFPPPKHMRVSARYQPTLWLIIRITSWRYIIRKLASGSRRMPIPIKDGLAICFIDITERKKTEELVLEQNHKLREIAWIQSHKVCAPLARMMGLIQIINRENFADPNNELLLKYLLNEAYNLDKINTEVIRGNQRTY